MKRGAIDAVALQFEDALPWETPQGTAVPHFGNTFSGSIYDWQELPSTRCQHTRHRAPQKAEIALVTPRLPVFLCNFGALQERFRHGSGTRRSTLPCPGCISSGGIHCSHRARRTASVQDQVWLRSGGRFSYAAISALGGRGEPGPLYLLIASR